MRKLFILVAAGTMAVLLTMISLGGPGSAQPAEVDVGIELLGIVGATGDPPTLRTEITSDAPDLTIVKEERITHSTPVDQRLHFQWFPPPGMTWHCDRTKVPPEQGQDVQCTVSKIGSPESRVHDPDTTRTFFGVLACADFDGKKRVDCEELKAKLDALPNWDGAKIEILGETGAAKQATEANIVAEINAKKQLAKPGDEFVFYIAGHNVCGSSPDPGAEDPGDDENVDIVGGEITDDELATYLSGFKDSVTITVMIHACNAGGFVDGTADLPSMKNDKGTLLTPGHLEVLMSSRAGENSFVDLLDGTARGAFAKFVLECLEKVTVDSTETSQADKEGNKDGITTSKELFDCAEPKTVQRQDQLGNPMHPQYKDNRTATTPPPCPTVPPFKYDHELKKCTRVVPNSTRVVTTAPKPPDTINTCSITEGAGGHNKTYEISDCDLDYEKKLPAGTPGTMSPPGVPNFEQTQPWNKVVKDSEPGSHQITECVTIQPEDPFVDPNPANNEDCLTFIINQLPPTEVVFFPDSLGTVRINTPFGSDEVTLTGPTKVEVDFTSLGDADSDTREEVQTEIVQMELTGTSSLLGPVTVRLRDSAKHPFQPSTGEIEETTNNIAGMLDIPPFTPTGGADSFFDVFFEIEVPGAPPGLQLLHNATPKHMQATITHKPPGVGETYEDPTSIPLLDETNTLTPVTISATHHTPNPPKGGGGIAEPIVLGSDAAAETSAPGSSRDYTAPIAAAAAVAGVLALMAGGWYVRRRWLR